MEKDRKKKIIALLVLVVISTLSVAFASISRTININGTAKMDTATWDVHFDNLSKANLINDAEEVSVPNYADNKGTIENINVKLKNPKDEVIYTVDIVNDGSIDAEVTVTSITELNEQESKLFDFGVYYSDGIKITKYDLLEAGQSKEITIKLRYKDDITEFDLPEVPLTINFGFTLNYIQSDASMVVTPNDDLENVVSTLAKGANTGSTSTFFNGNITKESVESITFLSTLKVPKEVQSTAWDASLNKDGSVVAWYTDLDENNLYELNIGGNGKVYAPSDSYCLFYNFNKLKEIKFNNAFDISKVEKMQSMFNSDIALTNLDLSSFDTSNVTNMSWVFENCEKLESLDLSSFDTSKVTTMAGMFQECFLLTTLDLSSFDTSNITNMSRMFKNCEKLESLDLSSFNTSKVTTMADMFQGCFLLTTLDLSSFDTSNVTNMGGMFSEIKMDTIDVSNFNTSNVTNMGGMFNGIKMDTIDVSNFNTSKVTTMEKMFYGAELNTLDLSGFNTEKVTTFKEMFRNAQINELDMAGWDTSKVTNMWYMFMNSNIPILDLSSFDTSNVTIMDGMFAQTYSTNEIKFNKLNTSNVTNAHNVFFRCSAKTLDISEVESSMYSSDAFKEIISNLEAGKIVYVLNEECVTLGQAINPNVTFVVKNA